MTQGLKGGLEDAPLAAADYRAPIVDVEAILFSPGPLTMEDRIRLAASLDAMRRDLDARATTNLAKFSARECGTLAGMSRGLGELGGDDLERVRQNWMRVRSNTFDDAAWFRFSESDPVAPREEPRVVLAPEDRALLDRVRSAFDGIEAAIARGERDCERLGEPGNDPQWRRDHGESHAEAWREWGESWRRELGGVRDRFP